LQGIIVVAGLQRHLPEKFTKNKKKGETMLYRTVPKTGDTLSILGFGCMRLPLTPTHGIDEARAIRQIRYAIDNGVNYLDTAPAYHLGRSEPLLGRALTDGYREKVRIATKLPPWSVRTRKDMGHILDGQLVKLKTSHIDYYLLHSLAKENWEAMLHLGVLEFLDQAKQSGKIINAGFSFHGNLDTFRTIVDAYDWEFCQVQYNFLDEMNQVGTEGLNYGASKRLAVMVMEPLRGGSLAGQVPAQVGKIWKEAPVRRTPAEWGLRFVWDHPEVTVVLSGMNQESHLEENIKIAGEAGPCSLTSGELGLIARVRDAYTSLMKVGCTGCGYCMPCPAGVNIPECFALYNGASMFGNRREYAFHYLTRHGGITGDRSYAGLCRNCGKCENICPQHLPIQAGLKEVSALMEGRTMGAKIAVLQCGLWIIDRAGRMVRIFSRNKGNPENNEEQE
jgi:predicted aldo/keto reductase-like oxidoreductase